jgi:hypothetical protein
MVTLGVGILVVGVIVALVLTRGESATSDEQRGMSQPYQARSER